MRRPDLTSAFTIRPTGMALDCTPQPSKPYFATKVYSPDDLSIEYDHPYYHNYTTTSLSQKGSCGPENKLTSEQTKALFDEAKSYWQASFKKAKSVTPPRKVDSFVDRFDPRSFRHSIKGQEGQGR